ncbi:NIPSNAP family protein [Roseateles sp. NT4]|uniref:NIPSNAP family protein n=1 Tax=Roseateles sp. NT4 TaxID=3453715 RepID=UPI003EEEBB5A
MPLFPATTPPAVPDCQVVELRQYTLHPGKRDTLIELFDREFVESQEALGIRVIGQFRDLDGPDRFVWLRGFADMAARGDSLPAFYFGPVWAQHRNTANPTMIDSDNVLLLRPAWAAAALPSPAKPRAERGSTALPPGLVVATVFHLKAPAGPEQLALARGPLSEALRAAGAKQLAWYVTEATANNFPRLPVREGEHVLVSLALFDDAKAALSRDFGASLQPWLAKPTQALRLVPTARSALHA